MTISTLTLVGSLGAPELLFVLFQLALVGAVVYFLFKVVRRADKVSRKYLDDRGA